VVSSRIAVGSQIEPVVKHVTQEKINLFEACGLRGEAGGGFHTDPEAAIRRIGMATPIASGRVQLTFATEALRRFFGAEIFNHTGTLDMRFVKPVVDGDTITVHGFVTELATEAGGTRVTLEVWCENHTGAKTALGTGSAVIPR
jgi:acyl dehydratase